jgi:hypothetical protein
MTATVQRRHRTTAASITLALVLAACGASGGETTDSAPATAAPTTAAPDTVAPDTAAPTTAAPDTAPPTTEAGPPADITLGFDLSSGDINATREKYGVSGQNSNLLNEDYYVALIDSYNEAGGINGHTIVPVTYTAPTGDVPSDVKNQERCEAYFAGDTVANVVVGTNDPILNTCATDAGAILFGRGFTGLDQASLDQFPGHVNPQAATFDRAALATVDLAVAEGKLNAGDTVGVAYPGCEAQTAVFENTLRPVGGRRGHRSVGTAQRRAAVEGRRGDRRVQPVDRVHPRGADDGRSRQAGSHAHLGAEHQQRVRGDEHDEPARRTDGQRRRRRLGRLARHVRTRPGQVGPEGAGVPRQVRLGRFPRTGQPR